MNTLRDGAVPGLPIFDVGAAGVDIFFVISGFIMWSTTAAQPISGPTFMKRRIFRIVPLYWALTLVTVFVTTNGGLRLDFDTDYPRLFRSLLFIPQWNEKYPMVAPNMIAGWTLELEMLFYAIFAAVLWLPAGKRIATVLLVLTLLALTRVFVDSRSAIFTAYTNNIVLEFGMGLVLGRLYERGFVRGSAIVGGGLMGLAVLLVVLHPRMHALRCVYFGIPALLLVSGALTLEPWLQGRIWRLPKFLGDASYSIYLVQMMAMAISAKLIRRALPSMSTCLQLGFQVVFATAVGCLVYLFLEKPLTAASRHLLAFGSAARVGRRL